MLHPYLSDDTLVRCVNLEEKNKIKQRTGWLSKAPGNLEIRGKTVFPIALTALWHWIWYKYYLKVGLSENNLLYDYYINYSHISNGYK